MLCKIGGDNTALCGDNIKEEQFMKRVVIGVSDSGEMYVVSKSRNVEVVFKKRKKPTLKKRIRTWWFHLKRWMISVIQG